MAGVGAGAVVIPASIYFVSGSVRKYTCMLIKKQLNYLKLEENSVEKYVEDYFKDTNDALTRMKWKSMYYFNVTWEESNTLKDLIKYYLLSTDFFINKIDENKTVKYIGLYNPYKSPVPNPFAYTLYPPTEIPKVK